MDKERITMSCKNCSCLFSKNINRDGCFYLYKEGFNRLHSICPCQDCLVQMLCIDRYNICEEFHNFLVNGVTAITREAKRFRV